MTSEVHEFEAKEGGRFRASLTYDDSSAPGKSSEHTDTYHRRFASLIPDERVVEVIEFETTNASMSGEMTITEMFSDDGRSTLIDAVHDNVPAGIRRKTTSWVGVCR